MAINSLYNNGFVWTGTGIDAFEELVSPAAQTASR